ncbi:hypothetical Protein YC6258_01335 [Gynuella sunshinyii YC6258]|uniref:Uncharacterized protein n=1 Tax=Gynuella sunshinyii YC6258 TaxID=1445510 RepID=A0A0C5VJ19_9GAMM|nr:hypothetical Protein YC6258_01335 [Gynuella sunshinyii YC6258]
MLLVSVYQSVTLNILYIGELWATENRSMRWFSFCKMEM